MNLTEDQENAVEMIRKWFITNNKQCFSLAGYAGTGKSFLINYIIENTLPIDQHQIAFCAPTGKAASVLIKKGLNRAVTIHKLIYDLVENETIEEKDGKKIKKKSFYFKKKDSKELANYRLIIVDEVSMVERKIMEDLKSFGIPILCCGDIGQLPPLFEANDILLNPDIILKEVVRQNEDSPIIKLATMARNKIDIPCGKYGDSYVCKRSDLTEDQYNNLLNTADQVICGLNNTRRQLNHKIREINNIYSEIPQEGEKLICLLNNWSLYLDNDKKYNMVNGIIGNCYKINKLKSTEDILYSMSFKADFLNDIAKNVIFNTESFKDNKSKDYNDRQNYYILSDGSYRTKTEFTPKKKDESDSDFMKRLREYVNFKTNVVGSDMLNVFDFGYAISCHKSQGSEFDNVVLIDESRYFKDSEKWLYTAITRAKKKIIIIK